MSQKDEILKALLAGEKITPLDALYKYGCFRLGARIWDLKQQGYDIKSQHTQCANGKFVSTYFIQKEVPPGTNYQLI